MDKNRKNKRILLAQVLSDKMDKTAVVKVERLKAHPQYKRQFKVIKKYHVHNPDNKYKKGDKVKIKETRPLSATKRWVIVEKIKG